MLKIFFASRKVFSRAVTSLILRLLSTPRFDLNSLKEAMACSTVMDGFFAEIPASSSKSFCEATAQLRVWRDRGLTTVPSGATPAIQIGHLRPLRGQFGLAFEVSGHRASWRR